MISSFNKLRAQRAAVPVIEAALEAASTPDLPLAIGTPGAIRLGDTLESHAKHLKERAAKATARRDAIAAEQAKVKSKMGGTATTDPLRLRFDALSRELPHAEADVFAANAAVDALTLILGEPDLLAKAKAWQTAREAATVAHLKSRVRAELVPEAIALYRQADALAARLDEMLTENVAAGMTAGAIATDLCLVEDGIASGIELPAPAQFWDARQEIHNALAALTGVRPDAHLLLTKNRG